MLTAEREKDPETAVLKCDPEHEAQIFESVPLDVWTFARKVSCPVLAFEGNTPDDVHHVSAAENVARLVPNAELRPSAWSHEEWDVIGQHDHTFAGIAATNRYSMKAPWKCLIMYIFPTRLKKNLKRLNHI